jgi:hypothetical protein
MEGEPARAWSLIECCAAGFGEFHIRQLADAPEVCAARLPIISQKLPSRLDIIEVGSSVETAKYPGRK